MVLKSAGCDIQVTEDDINDIDNVDGKLGELQEEFQAVGLIIVGNRRVLTGLSKISPITLLSPRRRVVVTSKTPWSTSSLHWFLQWIRLR